MKYEVELPDGDYCNWIVGCPFLLEEEGYCVLLGKEPDILVVRWEEREKFKGFGKRRPYIKLGNCPCKEKEVMK